MTLKPFPITPEYTVPTGSMVIPSFWNSLHDPEVYPEPDSFIPERWMPKPDGTQPIAESKPQNYMVWGSGPHKVCPAFPTPVSKLTLQCIGIQYASMHLAATLGTASVTMDWEHERTPESDQVQYVLNLPNEPQSLHYRVIATIFPKDGLRLKFTPRAPPS